jgi:serine/threonine protein kinase
MWALGVLLFTMLCGQFPYRGSTDEELYGKISRAEYKIPSDIDLILSKDAKELISSLFNLVAEKRPLAKEVMYHDWLKDTPLPKQSHV